MRKDLLPMDHGSHLRERMRELHSRRVGSGFSGIVFGLLVVSAGVVILLHNLEIINANRWWRLWPVGMIAFGLSRMVGGWPRRGNFWGLMVALFGLAFLADNYDWFQVDAKELLWPILLIGLGVHMLSRAIGRRRNPEAAADVRRTLNEWAVFGGSKRQITAPDFEGGECLAIFGGVEIDLSKAGMTKSEISIDINALFGGVELQVPASWLVTVKGAAIFGGYEDKTIPPREGESKGHLLVTGFAMFGGVTLKN